MHGRRVCPNCHKSFNICGIEGNGYIMPALLPKGSDHTVCDDCEGPIKLIKREDDNEEIYRKRLELYR